MGKITKKRIIYPTDPDYLETFYRLFGSGQSTTTRLVSSAVESEKTVDPPTTPRKGTKKRPGKV